MPVDPAFRAKLKREIVASESLLDLWLAFRAIYDRANIPEREIERQRHAFYAGASCAMGFLFSDQRDEAGLAARYEALFSELQAFKYDIKPIGGITQ